jgi:hypothetical protein
MFFFRGHTPPTASSKLDGTEVALIAFFRPDDTGAAMRDKACGFDKAAEALQKAMRTGSFGDQERLVDEALRLNRKAHDEQRAKAGPAPLPSVSGPPDDGAAS